MVALRLADRQPNPKQRPSTEVTFNFHGSAVEIGGVLDDREAEAGAALFARASFVDPVEPLEESVDRLGRTWIELSRTKTDQKP